MTGGIQAGQVFGGGFFLCNADSSSTVRVRSGHDALLDRWGYQIWVGVRLLALPIATQLPLILFLHGLQGLILHFEIATLLLRDVGEEFYVVLLL